MSGAEGPWNPAGGERRAAAALIYVGGVVQCMAQVSFAASATVFRERLGFTDAEYGSICLPQITLATLGAISAGALAQRLGLRRLLVLGTLALAASQAALASSVLLPRPFSFLLVLAGTSLMGLGAGTSAAPMNAYAQLLFPFGRESALVGLHAVNGLGLTAGPLLASALLARDAWVTLLSVPLATSKPAALALFAIFGLVSSGSFPLTVSVASRHSPEHVPWVSSMVYAGFALGVGAGPFVVGILRPHGSLTRLYGLSAIYPILSVLLGEFVRRRGPSKALRLAN